MTPLIPRGLTDTRPCVVAKQFLHYYRNGRHKLFLWNLHVSVQFDAVFTARRHASAVYAVVVCLSVCLSQVGVLLKPLNVGSRKQRYTIVKYSILVF